MYLYSPDNQMDYIELLWIKQDGNRLLIIGVSKYGGQSCTFDRITRLRRKLWPPGRGGMRVSFEALAKEDWSFGGLRRTEGATGSCPWGSTIFVNCAALTPLSSRGLFFTSKF